MSIMSINTFLERKNVVKGYFKSFCIQTNDRTENMIFIQNLISKARPSSAREVIK